MKGWTISCIAINYNCQHINIQLWRLTREDLAVEILFGKGVDKSKLVRKNCHNLIIRLQLKVAKQLVVVFFAASMKG
jgi:hypothetical protein